MDVTNMSGTCDSLADVTLPTSSHSDIHKRKTIPSPGSPTSRYSPEPLTRRLTVISNNRLKNAKLQAEAAVKNRKVFTIQGPYPAVRESLRRRGWVEQFYKAADTGAKKPHGQADSSSSDSDDDDDDGTGNVYDGDGNPVDVNDHGGQIPPWEEENGLYSIMSRTVRNVPPTFIWGVRRDCVDPKLLEKDQIINHYGHASFTTKVGLCVHLRDLPWFEQADCNTFFPRCYRLSHEEEKDAFIDDYVLNACVGILKYVISALSTPRPDDEPDSSRPTTRVSSVVPVEAVTMALKHCKLFLASVNHEDIDLPIQLRNEEELNQIVNYHYKVVLGKASVSDVDGYKEEIIECLTNIKQHCPQYELDGTNNVWIVKPGAKSRGRVGRYEVYSPYVLVYESRGMMEIQLRMNNKIIWYQCYNRLDDILKLVNTQVVQKDSKYVIQKYIEKPLLIYLTKFDIRQWFVVTDWNPFTVWFYKECYLRFCSQEYTLADLDESIHLSNNSIQKNYKNGQRAAELPDDNMWHCDRFKEFLKEKGMDDMWDTVIYPGMKAAVTNALLCCQDVVEQRKNAFELYGADFMLTEDCHPWLIEINSSPCMAPSTKITAKMCPSVLEDTIRVVLDRRTDKNVDTGMFELIYRQAVISVPPYIGMNLQVDGQAVKKPGSSGSQSVKFNTGSNELPTHDGDEATTYAICSELRDVSATAGSKVRHSVDAEKRKLKHLKKRDSGIKAYITSSINAGDDSGNCCGGDSVATERARSVRTGMKARRNHIVSRLRQMTTASDSEVTVRASSTKLPLGHKTMIPGLISAANIPHVTAVLPLKANNDMKSSPTDGKRDAVTSGDDSTNITTESVLKPILASRDTFYRSLANRNNKYSSNFVPLLSFATDQPKTYSIRTLTTDCITANTVLPTMPYFASRPVGSRRRDFSNSTSSRMNYSNAAVQQRLSDSRECKSINIVVIGNSTTGLPFAGTTY